MATPNSYKTLKGLLKATERTLKQRHEGATRIDGQSVGMWLHNATYCAEANFQAAGAVRELQAKYSTTRAQDLVGGHSLFGAPLPSRDYMVGDNIPGLGEITDATSEQLCIKGSWYHRCCFDTPTQSLR